MERNWFHSELARRQLEHGRDESLQALYAALLVRHAGQCTRGATAIAVRQTFVAQMISEGYEERETAERLQIGLRTVERDVAELKRVYERVPRRSLDAPATGKAADTSRRAA
jgi:DNA-binding NarL/FixJ family response regulator